MGPILTEVAKRGPFRMTVTERGHLDSMKNATLVSRVEGSTTIISIIPEGTIVKKGDVLCELDSSTMRESLKQQEIAVTQAEAAKLQSKENVGIQETQNESDIAAAELAIDLAGLDLKKYELGDTLQAENELLGRITNLNETLTLARDTYDFAKRIAKKGYETQNQLEAKRIAVTKAEIDLNVEEGKLKVLKEFTRERDLAELRAAAKETKLELVRVHRKAKAGMTQYESDHRAQELTAEVEQSKLKRLKEQIAACKLVAPQDGEVVYATEESRRGGDANIIEEGASVRERQAIIKLPDFSEMKVNARIHESRIGNVRVGLPVNIRVDANPGKVYQGVVDSIASVPAPADWMNRDLKHYETIIRLTDEADVVKSLRPGLTAGIEIIVKSRDDVLQIPVQAVVTIGNKHYSFVADDEEGFVRRDVVLGDSNDEFVEILDGVGDGEKVAMSPRTNFDKEIRELEDAAGIKEDGEKSKSDKRPPGAKGGPGGRPGAKGGPGGRPGVKGGPGGRPGAGGPGGKNQAGRKPGAGGPGAGGSGFSGKSGVGSKAKGKANGKGKRPGGSAKGGSAKGARP